MLAVMEIHDAAMAQTSPATEYFAHNINGTLQELGSAEGVSPFVQTYLVNNDDNLDIMNMIQDDLETANHYNVSDNSYSDPNIGQAVFSTANGQSAVVIEDLDSHHIIKEKAVTVNTYYDDNDLKELPVVEEIGFNTLESIEYPSQPVFEETLLTPTPAPPQQKLFECRQCDYSAKDRWKLNRHIKVHESRKTFHCVQCQTVFYEADEFYEHLKFHHEVKKPFVCTECVYRCTDRWKLTRHVKCHKYKLPYTNQDFKFRWKDDNVWVEPELPRAPEELRRKANNKKDMEEEENLDCTQCEFKTRSKLKLQKHMKKEHNIVLKSGFACTECNFVTKRENGLKIHMAIHTGVLPFGCTECDYRCDSSWKLKRHSLVHTRDKTKKPFKCAECDFSTTTANGLKAHSMVHTGEKPFACNECDYRSRDNWKLTRHMLTHTGEKQFACDVCNFKAVELGVLKRHKLIHSGDKPFACTQCEYRCIDNGRLKRHMLVHSNENPFGCDQCEYKCRTKWQLKKHTENNHSAEKLAAAAEKLAIAQTRPKVVKKRFPCSECKHKSKTINGLKMHMITHTGEKPFACEQCDYRSKDTWKLKRHMQIHTGENPFSCKVCGYKCKANWQLKKHMKTHDSEKKNNKPEDDYYNNGSEVDHEGINMEDFLQVGISEQHEEEIVNVKKEPHIDNAGVVAIKEEPLDDDYKEESFIDKCGVVAIKEEPPDNEGSEEFSQYLQNLHSAQFINGDVSEINVAIDVNQIEEKVYESEKGNFIVNNVEELNKRDEVNHKSPLKDGISVNHESHIIARENDRLKRFTCTECEHKCRDRWHLNRHMMTHTGENPFACKKCDYKCKTKVQIQKHMKHCSENKSNKQRKLSKKKIVADIKTENSLIENNENLINLVMNNIQIKSEPLLLETNQNLLESDIEKDVNKVDSNVSTEHETEGMNMGEFLEVGISEEGITNPLKEGRKRKRKFDCKDCGQNFKDSWRLKRHSKIHLRIDIICPHCDYKCKTKGNLRKHMKTHSNKEVYAQDANVKTFTGISQEAYLEMDNKNFDENQSSSNHFLNEQYIDNESYYENQESTKDDLVLQDFLDGSYSKMSYSELEEKNLSENKPFREKKHACTECDYKARDKYSLNKHMARHTGRKDFFCVECEFKCEDARGLKKHVLHHHMDKEAKPFACDMCDYRCKDSWKLKRHKKSHSRPKSTKKDKEWNYDAQENKDFKSNLNENEHSDIRDNIKSVDCRTESEIFDNDRDSSDITSNIFVEYNSENDSNINNKNTEIDNDKNSRDITSNICLEYNSEKYFKQTYEDIENQETQI